MFAWMAVGSVECTREVFVEDIVDKRTFARTGYPGDAGEKTKWNFDVDIFEIVMPGAYNFKPFLIRYPPGI